MRRLKCVLLVIVICASMFTVARADGGFSSDDIDISDLLFGETNEDISYATPSFSDMELVAENDSLKLYFNPTGLDIFLVSNTGKVWSNVITDEYYHQESPVAEVSSQLVTVNAADKKGNVNEYILYDGSNKNISADYDIKNNKLTLDVSVANVGLSFKVIFGISKDGFYYHVPDKDIKENGGKIISLSLLQNFGASRNDEDGYVFYPDGSGAITRFGKNNNASSSLYQFPIYGSSDLTYVQLQRNWDDNIYGALLPVYGIKQTNDGLVAVVDKGAADAKINVALPGYQLDNIYRTYITYNYRSYSTTEFNNATISSLVDERTKVDRKCWYYFLDGENNNYSGMANRVREHLISKGKLGKKNNAENIPLSLNLLCGVQKNGMFTSSLEKMTTFKQAKEIVSWFNSNGADNLDVLLSGWSKGGWDTLPTAIKAESGLGGKSELKKLDNFCDNKGISLSLEADVIMADSNTGKFNARNHAVRNYFGDFFKDKTGKKYLLNATLVMDNAYKTFKNSYSDFGVSLLTVGKIAFPDYNNKNVCTTQEIINSYVSFMKKAQKDKISVSATTGNAYILPYVDMIYSLPQSDSGYTFASESVPFYQMVVHGYVQYTGVVGNTHYDFDRCVLEWVETGSAPSFILTYQKTSKLLETAYDEVFSSEYSVWKDKIIKTYKKLNSDFKEFNNETISSHEKIAEGVYRITYSNQKAVYVNYNSEPFSVGENTVEGKNYLIMGE